MVQRFAERHAMSRLAKEGRSEVLPIRFPAQHAEDVLLTELFEGRDRGFFVEAGGLDGVRYSNTYVLEALGWRGLLVEPIPELAAQCKNNRPNSRVEQVALSAPGHPPTASLTRYLDESSVGASRLEDASTSRARGPRGSAAIADRIEVKLTTLNDLLDGKDRIDLISLDIEGHELEALQGLDLERYRPAVILVEDHSLGRAETLRRHLDDHGYEHCGWIAWNRLCVRRDEPELLARARDLLGTG